jgi:hypothetical protein
MRKAKELTYLKLDVALLKSRKERGNVIGAQVCG